jgi:hypothetical protein
MGISETTFYRWKQLYGGLLPSELKELLQLEEENARLRRRSDPRQGDAAGGDPPKATSPARGGDRLRAGCIPHVDPQSVPGDPRLPRTSPNRAGAYDETHPGDRYG